MFTNKNVVCGVKCGFDELFENWAKNKEVLWTDKEPSAENVRMSTVNIEVEQITLYRLNLSI